MRSVIWFLLTLLAFSQAIHFLGFGKKGYKNLKKSAKCLKLSKTAGTLFQDFCNQPLYLTVTKNEGMFKDLDNVCILLGPPVKTIHAAYAKFTYTNGTTHQEMYTLQSALPGSFTMINMDLQGIQIKLGWACDTSVEYVCPADEEEGNYPVGVSSIYGPLNDCCVKKFAEVLEKQHLNHGDWYALPMKQPANCPLIGASHPIATCSRITNMFRSPSGC